MFCYCGFVGTGIAFVAASIDRRRGRSIETISCRPSTPRIDTGIAVGCVDIVVVYGVSLSVLIG